MHPVTLGVIQTSSKFACTLLHCLNCSWSSLYMHTSAILFLVLLVHAYFSHIVPGPPCTCILQPYCYACLGCCSDEDMQSTYSHMTTVGVVMDDHDSDEETFPLPSNGVKPAEHKETKLNPGGCGRCQVLW